MSRSARPPNGEEAERGYCGVPSLRLCASVVVALALVLALAGAVLSARLVTAPTAVAFDQHGAHQHGAAGSVRASFGSLAVADVQTLPGLTARAVAGVTHFPSYVPETAMQVRVVVVLTNALDGPVRYDPQQFRLRAGSRTTRASGGSTLATAVEPRASLEARLEFVVPRGGSRLRLEFRDPGRLRPIVIDLGRARERAVKKVETHAH
jgi:hypothetical protein